MPYVPHTPDQIRDMLEVIGASSVRELFAEIPPELAPKSFDLPPGLSEMETVARIQGLSRQNRPEALSFLGAGCYDHYVPPAIGRITGRGEFYTAYTPYQPEASQGTLQAIFEYQTAVTRLLGLPCANASVYDGGTALYEAVMMAVRHTKRRKVVVSQTVNPIHRDLLASCTRNLDLEIVRVAHIKGQSDFSGLAKAVDAATACVVVANPNFFGCLEDAQELFTLAKAHGALGVMSVYPVLQALLKTPGEMGADIAVADGQSLGLPLSLGGPYLGIMCCSKALVRQMPGRIAGRTLDSQGRTGYVLTLQAREQHIRRQKATSNICSNQALCALRCLVHLCLLGEEGLRRTAILSLENARALARELTALPGVQLLNQAVFGNEFALVLPKPAKEVCQKLVAQGLIPGLPLCGHYPGLENVLLVCCTEKHSPSDLTTLAAKLKECL